MTISAERPVGFVDFVEEIDVGISGYKLLESRGHEMLVEGLKIIG